MKHIGRIQNTWDNGNELKELKDKLITITTRFQISTRINRTKRMTKQLKWIKSSIRREQIKGLKINHM